MEPSWTQLEQCKLDDALRAITKDSCSAKERWSQVASRVGRTPRECAERFQFLRNMLKARSNEDQTTTEPAPVPAAKESARPVTTASAGTSSTSTTSSCIPAGHVAPTAKKGSTPSADALTAVKDKAGAAHAAAAEPARAAAPSPDPPTPPRPPATKAARLREPKKNAEKRPCRFFQKPGGCSKGANCLFVHAATSAAAVEPAPAAPPQVQAKAACRFFGTAGCPQGAKCIFFHGAPSTLSVDAQEFAAPAVPTPHGVLSGKGGAEAAEAGNERARQKKLVYTTAAAAADAPTPPPGEPGEGRSKSKAKAKAKATSKSLKGKDTKGWWRTVDELDPISLEPISELKYPPFELRLDAESGRGHLFDGRLLALYFVASGVFEDPMNRREVTKAQADELDLYLRRNRLGPPWPHVGNAWELCMAKRAAGKVLCGFKIARCGLDLKQCCVSVCTCVPSDQASAAEQASVTGAHGRSSHDARAVVLQREGWDIFKVLCIACYCACVQKIVWCYPVQKSGGATLWIIDV